MKYVDTSMSLNKKCLTTAMTVTYKAKTKLCC